MISIDFQAFLLALAAILLFYFLWRRRRHFAEPHLYFSDIDVLTKEAGRSQWGRVPQALLWTSLGAFALAFIDPHRFVEKPQPPEKEFSSKSPTEGIAIYLVLDQSGSMFEESGRRRRTKIDLMKEVTKEFVAGDQTVGLAGRPNDMIGLISFARGAQVLSPLTLDHAAILQKLSELAPVEERDQDGTSIGYAIFKTANMIAATRHYAQELIEKGEPAYTIKNSVMILVTDGLQDPNPLDKGKRLRNMDIREAAEYAKEQGIRLYIVNVEPKLATEEFAPHRRLMQRSAELTGGKFYTVDSASNLEAIYSDIDKLEKSELPEDVQKGRQPDRYRRISYYPYLIAIGLCALFAALLLETTVLRRIP